MKLSKHVAVAALLCALAPLRAGAAGSPVTLFLSSGVAASDVDEALASGGVGDGPTLDPEAPSGSVPKTASVSAAGAQGFRKNVLGAWWAGSFSGIVEKPVVHFWAYTAATISLDVALFKNGPPGRTPPIAVASVRAVDGFSEYVAVYPDLIAAAPTGLVVQVFASTLGGQGSNAAVLFGSTDYPSSISFQLS